MNQNNSHCERSEAISEIASSASRPPRNDALAATACFLIRLYQLFLSPLFGGHCRFFPSCSEYAREAVETHGVFSGAAKAAARLLRCHPFSGGGYDPVSK